MGNNGTCFPNNWENMSHYYTYYYKSIMRVQTEVQNCDSSVLINFCNTKEIYYKS